jgi:hypothetical protein
MNNIISSMKAYFSLVCVPESQLAQEAVAAVHDGGTERPMAFDSKHQATTKPPGNIVQYLELNKPPVTFSSHVVASDTANGIIHECEQNDWTMVSLDNECAHGIKHGPDVIQITTLGLDKYFFKGFKQGYFLLD